ncbi:UspA domain protein [Halobacterium hubeiense]|uniref:UspA domain protein n=1 Tax=Halobacterium hubeiense TaxID=1407499 RepID=A0A0U5HUK9_9EURY|nr:universal stress protein [Halobacterium hubeiense]CQH57637.1 UspA domain protein [Halobacterium hubeiense]
MYSTILVPTDGSEGASEAVGVALALAERFDAEVHALFVVDERFVATDYDLVVEEAETEAERALDAAGEQGAAAGVGVEKHLRTGLPHEEILDAADDYGADLVVMGKHGRSGLDRFLSVGSVTERVVRRAEVQVTTVPVSRGGE